MPERLSNGVPFAFVEKIGCERDDHGRVAVETPARLYANPNNLPLGAYGRGPFSRLALQTDEMRAGVFAIAIGERLLFVAHTETALAAAFQALGLGRIESRACFVSRDETRCRASVTMRG